MKALVDFFVGFGEVISGIIDFVVGFFQDLIYAIGLLGKFLLEIPTYFSWLPGPAVASLVTTFSIVVIYMVLNRK